MTEQQSVLVNAVTGTTLSSQTMLKAIEMLSEVKEVDKLKTIIYFQSKYGSSKQYALWLAEDLQCEARETESVSLDDLRSYDVILCVGGLYASGVSGFGKIKKHLGQLKSKSLLLCMVGMTNPVEKERYEEVFRHNVPEEYRSFVKPFALRGDQLFSKMSGLHKMMMKIPKKAVEKIPVEERTEENRLFLESFGKDTHFVSRENIREIVEYVRGLSE